MTKSRYITSPPSDMVLPATIKSSKGNVIEIEEALSIARTVLNECLEAAEQSYLQNNVLKRALMRVHLHLYGLRAKR